MMQQVNKIFLFIYKFYRRATAFRAIREPIFGVFNKNVETKVF